MTQLLLLLALLDLEFLAGFLWVFFTPSERGQGVFLWLSQERLALAVFLLVLLAALLAVTLRLWRSPDAAERLLKRLDLWLLDQCQLVPVQVALLAVTVGVLLAVSAVVLTPMEFEVYQSLAPDTFPLLSALTYALLPVLALAVLACLEASIFLQLRYPRALRSPEVYDWDRIGPSLLLLLIAGVTVFYWLVLIFQLRFFLNLPAWYWIFAAVPFSAGDPWFALGALILLGLAHWLLILKRRLAVGLLAAAALGLFLQFGPGLMGGRGLDSLRDRYFTTYHEAYLRAASGSDLSLLDTVRRYEDAYGSGSFTGTKPPGLMVFYSALDHLANGYPSELDDAARYQRLSALVVWLFPLLAVSMVVLLLLFVRSLLEDPSALVQRLAPLLYVLSPSVALFTFFADQAIYPAVFLLGAWFAVMAVRQHSLIWAFLLGVALYAGAFFAFTLLPLYVFAGSYLLLHFWRETSGKRMQQIVLSSLAVLAGTLLAYFLARALLNYDFLPRFERTMAINHNFDFYLRVGQQPPSGPEPLSVRLGQILSAAWINNLDFAAALGFPVYSLFLVQAVRRVRRFIKGRASSGEIILFALLLSYIVLNLAGTAQGEVPRLWLFWLPMVVLFAAYEIEPHLQKRPNILLALGVAQLVTLMLTFHFQDLRM